MVPLTGEIHVFQNVFVRHSFYELASFCVAGVGVTLSLISQHLRRFVSNSCWDVDRAAAAALSTSQHELHWLLAL